MTQGLPRCAGATADGAGVTQKLHRPAEVIVESVKRGAEEVTEVAKEACEARWGVATHSALQQICSE